jgi:integrase/recombinase XerC
MGTTRKPSPHSGALPDCATPRPKQILPQGGQPHQRPENARQSHLIGKIGNGRSSSTSLSMVSVAVERFSGLRVAVKDFLADKRLARLSPRTLEFYELHLRTLVEFLEGVGVTRPEDVTVHQLRHFLAHWQPRLKPMSLDAKWRAASALFAWCLREELIEKNPVARLERPKVPQKLIRPYEGGEIQQLLGVCDTRTLLGARDRAMIITLLDTGLRASELCGLIMDGLDGDFLRVNGKGDKERLVHLGREARRAIMAYLRKRPDDGLPWLFLSRKGVPLNRSSLHQRLSALAQRAGLDRGGVHRLRHAFAINAIRNGASVLDVKYCLGHSRLDTTQRYVSSFGHEDAGRHHATFSPADNLLARARPRVSLAVR